MKILIQSLIQYKLYVNNYVGFIHVSSRPPRGQLIGYGYTYLHINILMGLYGT